MLSESHTSSRSHYEASALTSELLPPVDRLAPEQVHSGLSSLGRWLAPLVVVVSTWATWQVGAWLLERWQIH